MNEEIEYAEMLEIPVSTVNVMKKNQRRRKQKHADAPPAEPVKTRQTPPAFTQMPMQDPLQDSVIAQVNDRLSESVPTEITAEADLFAEGVNSEGSIDFDPIPQRIDTVRLYSSDDTKRGFFHRRLKPETFQLEEDDFENDEGRYAFNDETPPSKGWKIALNAEFALACALCGAIFLTNVFMPNSAINTFFRSINNGVTAATDNRTYADFTLSAFVSERSDAELELSPTGILTFTDACCVYPAANGTVSDLAQDEQGDYRVKISYSDSFFSIIDGLDQVYYTVGENVKANVPLGYTNGEDEVQVTMYSGGVLLNCFELTEENCLAWLEE
ncbi:MAG: hypothetical protein IJX87_02475 [Clostridia bacterium]|nr:hypothetical protein [Clostridia bacterium]